jgi:hypothetical protein
VAPISVANHVSNFEAFFFVAEGYAHVAKQEVVDDPTMKIPINFLEVGRTVSTSPWLKLDS